MDWYGDVPKFWPYFFGIFPHIGLIYGRYLQFRILTWPLSWQMVYPWDIHSWIEQPMFFDGYPLVMTTSLLLNMANEIVDFPMKYGNVPQSCQFTRGQMVYPYRTRFPSCTIFFVALVAKWCRISSFAVLTAMKMDVLALQTNIDVENHEDQLLILDAL